MAPAMTRPWPHLQRIASIAILLPVSLLLVLGVGDWAPAGTLLLVLGGMAAALSPVVMATFTLLTVPFAFELHPVPSGAFSLLELGIVWSVVGVAVRHARHPVALVRRLGHIAVRFPWIVVAAGVLAAAALVSLLGLPPDAHRAEALREVRHVVLEPIAFAAVLLLLLSDGRSRAWIVAGLLAGGVAASVVALAQLFDADAGVIAGNVTRLTGPYSHPNNLALYLVRVAALTVPLAILRTGRLRWMMIGSFGIMSLALLLTFSRGGWLALGVAIMVMLLVLRRYRWVIWMLIAGAIAAIPGAVLLRERIFDLGGASSEPTRFPIWRSTWAMIRDNPLTGVGPDQFLYQYGRRYVEPIGWPERYTSHSHNFLLDFAVRLGAGGVAALVTMIGAVLAVVWTEIEAVRNDPVRLGVLGALIAGGIHGLIDNSYFLPDLAVMFWTFLVLLWVAPAQEHVVRSWS